MTALALSGLTKAYAGRPAVNDLSLTVAAGELLTIVGPSGSGKSTLLRLVAGLDKADRGSIALDGTAVEHTPPHQRRLAMVFQDHGLWPHLTVADNLALGARLRQQGLPRGPGNPQPMGDTPLGDLATVADELGIAGLLRRFPHQLSGGEQQRVALGRALLSQPRLLLLDEPFGQLDEPLRLQLRGLLRSLQQRAGLTTLMVTHDQDEAWELGTRLAVLQAGQLQQCDTPTTIYAKPANRFVASFLGRPPMNLIDGSMVGMDATFWFVAPGCRLRLPKGAAASASQGGDRGNPSVTLGIRPADLQLDDVAVLGDDIVAGRVTAVAELPGRWQATVELAGQTLTVCGGDPARRPTVGAVGVGFPAPAVHLFAGSTGTAWTSPAAKANPADRISTTDPG